MPENVLSQRINPLHTSRKDNNNVLSMQYLLPPFQRLLNLVFWCFTSLFLFVIPASAQSNEVIDEIVAIVGDQIILKSDVDGYVMGVAQQHQIPYSDELWKNALDQLINQKVLAVHAKRDTTLEISDSQVDQALDQRIAQLRDQVGGQSQLEELYGKSELQIKNDLRDDFRDQLLAEQFQNIKLQQIRVTPSEVKEWFSQLPADSLPVLPEMVRLAHIVRYPAITQAARDEAMEIISAIRDSVMAGASFEEMARLFSDDIASARNGGRDTGRRLSELVPEFAAVASRIEIGEISQVFETQFGLHFLRINQRQGDIIDYNHILIRFDESKADPTEAISFLETIRDSIVTHNAPFELMARRHSEEVSTASRGGRVVDPRSGSRDLPYDALGPTWKRTINTLQEGEISQPTEVELLDGRRAYHLLLLQKRVPSHTVDFVTDYERIQQIALQEKQARVLDEWVNKLRKDVYIETRGKAENLSVAEY